jgi:hypothetical protein
LPPPPSRLRGLPPLARAASPRRRRSSGTNPSRWHRPRFRPPRLLPPLLSRQWAESSPTRRPARSSRTPRTCQTTRTTTGRKKSDAAEQPIGQTLAEGVCPQSAHSGTVVTASGRGLVGPGRSGPPPSHLGDPSKPRSEVGVSPGQRRVGCASCPCRAGSSVGSGRRWALAISVAATPRAVGTSSAVPPDRPYSIMPSKPAERTCPPVWWRRSRGDPPGKRELGDADGRGNRLDVVGILWGLQAVPDADAAVEHQDRFWARRRTLGRSRSTAVPATTPTSRATGLTLAPLSRG